MIESPIASDSITNKQATQKESIYHTCRSVLNALSHVQGFEKYMDVCNDESGPTDPLNKLWLICKEGSSLCYLYNTLQPDTPIVVNKNNSSAANKSKHCVYHFIIACRDQLHFPEDALFTVTELYQNTNGFVKVVNTVKRILDLLEEKGIIHVDSLSQVTTDSPKNMRDNVVFELLSTERKYVQDLESLQNYMREVSAQDVLSQDTMHYLFGNLNALVDFQRKFLIQIEDQATHSPEEQRFGNLFIQYEDAFSVYEPFCANFQIAHDLVVQESHKLQKLSNIMSPTYELPSMLIKPIQRVCKYPLLIQQLIKATPEDWPFAEENKVGLEAIQRVTKKVNETKRLQENMAVVQDLKKRIVDDTTSNPTIIVDNAGQLLLHEKLTLQRHDNDHTREMAVYLFEKLILICKEIKDVNKNAITIKKKRKEGSLVVRGKISVARIEHVKGSLSLNGHYTLQMSWMEGEPQHIFLRCKNDEQLRQWLDVIIGLKEATNATKHDLIATAPQTPRMETNNPLLHYDEDEEDYYDGELNNSDDDRNSPVFMRNRSHSYQHHRYPTEVSSRKASLSNNSTARHFINGVPGMTLPPLPRSPTNLPTLSNASVSTAHSTESGLYSPSNLSFPSSPPTSYPPSPTTTVRTSSNSNNTNNNNNSNNANNGILPSGALWQRRQQSNDKSESPTKQTVHHVRARSQSSPNIQRPIHYHNTAPELPTLSSTNANIIYESRRKSNGYRYDTPSTPATPSPVPQHQDITKVKVHYFGAIYVVLVPTDIEFEELQRRIESKIKLCGQEFETSVLGLKYEDEDGDLITISSSEDVQMGFESKGPNNAVNLYVTS